MESFTNYQDVKTKTVNWCSKMLTANLLSPDQYDKCTSTFRNANSGILPNTLNMPAQGMSRSYSLYNTRSEKLTSNLSNENTNTVLLVTNTGEFMACNNNNSIYFVKDINNPNTNQNDLYFILLPQSNNVYSILSPHGGYLITNTEWGADFSGTGIGTMASWKISKVNDNIIMESVQYSGFFLSFIDNNKPLKIIYGKDASIQWTIIPKTESTINSMYADYTGSEYITRRIVILKEIYKNILDKIIFTYQSSVLKELQTQIGSNFDNISDYIQSRLNYLTNAYALSQINNGISLSGLRRLTRPLEGANLSNTEIGNILIKITNMKTYYINLIQNKINTINTQIASFNKLENEIQKLNTLESDMNTDIAQTINNIKQNNIIMGRQKDNYNQIDSNENYIENKKNKYLKLDNNLTVNLDIVNGNNTQSTLLVKIYPFIIVILLVFLIYLIYITSIKFTENIAKHY